MCLTVGDCRDLQPISAKGGSSKLFQYQHMSCLSASCSFTLHAEFKMPNLNKQE